MVLMVETSQLFFWQAIHVWICSGIAGTALRRQGRSVARAKSPRHRRPRLRHRTRRRGAASAASRPPQARAAVTAHLSARYRARPDAARAGGACGGQRPPRPLAVAALRGRSMSLLLPGCALMTQSRWQAPHGRGVSRRPRGWDAARGPLPWPATGRCGFPSWKGHAR